jgi:hypothetical protein
MARVTKVLADANINIRWVTVATSEGFGVIKFLVDKPETAFQRLRTEGLPVTSVEVLAIEMADRPGGLYQVADCLARNRINLENSSGFVLNNRAVLLIEVKDLAAATAALEAGQLKLLSEQETLGL